MKERPYLGALRCQHGRASVPGSTKSTCFKCGSTVWISPATQKSVVEVLDPIVTCVDCLHSMIQKEEQLDIHITQDQAREIQENL